MMLIGQYDSPFVRRVGIALRLYGLPFQHQPWSVFRDADQIRPFNPLVRVPTLVLDSGEALIETFAILDHIDRLVDPASRLFPIDEPARHRQLRIAALASGLADKAVSLFYERRLHDVVSAVWVDRCERQIAVTRGALEAECAALTTPYWFGDMLGHADIAVACSLRFAAEAGVNALAADQTPALAAFCARLEALPVFREIAQPFNPPA
jgi:glutathione S-transferase